MYFRKTVHCWCVGSSWIDLPVRVFINCLFTLEMLQAILKFKKVSDIVIVIAGLELSKRLQDVSWIVCFGRDIYYKAIQHFCFSCII